MDKALIQLNYRQVIDASSAGNFEQDVFNDSFREFQLQCQAYNRENKFKTLQELIENNPKANSLHYKVGFAVGLYLRELNNFIPGLKDESGNSILFSTHEFKIITSEIGNRTSHKVAVNYITPVLTLLKDFGGYMVLAIGDLTKQENNEAVIETFTLKMQDNLSVIRYQEIASKEVMNAMNA